MSTQDNYNLSNKMLYDRYYDSEYTTEYRNSCLDLLRERAGNGSRKAKYFADKVDGVK